MFSFPFKFSKTQTTFTVISWLVILIIAVFLRVWNLDQVPAGLHQDEAWFAYNAYLLKSTGHNIYNQEWPLTVDMWGDHVSSFHSFAIIPFISLFGVTTFAFRLPFVTATVLSLGLAAWLLYRWTSNRYIPLLFGALFATSQWNIIMSRASSTVVLDTLVTLITITVFYEGFRWFSRQKELITWKLTLWWLVSYGLSIFCYFTYFTSRITLPIFLLAVLFLSWVQFKLQKKLIVAGLLVIIMYMIFPFGVMLQTPYALGRYQETTVINGPAVQNQIFLDISKSGQAGLPVWLTHLFYNKVTENVRMILVQYVSFFSPSVVMFQTAPPVRYFVPQAGVVNLVEYAGLWLALGGLLLVVNKKNNMWRVAALASLVMTGVAVIPTALTVDDFPNFQRGVYVTPFWQMAAAVGWGLALSQLWSSVAGNRVSKKVIQSVSVLVLVVGIGISLLPFMMSYFAQSRYANVFNRSRAGEELGKWINAEAHDAVILMDHDEANFVYPFLYAQKDVTAIGIESPEQYLLKAPEFRIGSRQYVHKLCESEDLNQRIQSLQPQYIMVKKYPPYGNCSLPGQYSLAKTFSFDDGTVGYEVYSLETAN